MRRAHGDLHLGNLCLWHGRPVLFDALEFDDALATIDLGYDLAFLLMDLDRRADRAAANRGAPTAMWRVAAMLRSLQGCRFIFRSGRWARAHVQASRGEGDAADYLAAADAYLHPAPGLVVAVGGLPATGKSTLARALAPTLGAVPGALVLRSDETRKRVFGHAPEERLGADAYDAAANARTDAVLLDMLRDAATAAQAIIVDATCIDTRISRRPRQCGEGGRTALPRPLATGAAGRARAPDCSTRARCIGCDRRRCCAICGGTIRVPGHGARSRRTTRRRRSRLLGNT